MSKTAYLLNLADLAFTLHALGHGAVELNPIMRCVPLQIFYKVFVVGALLWWLSTRKEKIARLGIKTATAVFAAVDLWHIVNLAIIWL